MRIILIIFLLSLVSVSYSQTSIAFLHYNDLHAHLISHKDLVRNGEFCSVDENAYTQIGIRGGLSRLKTLVDSLRQIHAHSILMNIGDTYHGGVEAAYTSGNAVYPASPWVQPLPSSVDCIALSINKDAEFDPLTVKVYPNPTTNDLFINTALALPLSIRIYNTTGQLLLQQDNLRNTDSFSLNKLPAGTYYLRVISSEKIMDSQLIIKQ